MKLIFHRESSTQYIQKLRQSVAPPHDFVDKIAKVSIRKNLLLYFKLADLSDQECQKLHQNALLHQQVTMIDQFDLLNKKKKKEYQKYQIQKCECCKIPKGQKLSIFTSYEKFASLGMGVLMFFYFCEVIIVLSCLYFVIFGISSLVMNAKGASNAQIQYLVSNFYTRGIYEMFSIEKNYLNEDVLFLQSIVGLIWCIVFVITARISKNIGLKKERKFDRQIFTPSDLTIKIQSTNNYKVDLPAKNYTKQELNNFLVKKMNIPEFQIKKIFIAYEISHYQYIMQDIQTTSVQIYELKKQLIKETDEEIKKNKNIKLMKLHNHFSGQMDKLKKQIQNFQDQGYQKKLTTGYCLIRVNNELMKNLFLQKFQTDKLGSFDRYKHIIAAYCGFSKEKQYLEFKGNQLEITRAPQPIDIIWQNCRHQKTFQTRLGLSTTTIIIITADFTVLLMLMFLQYTLQKYNTNISNIHMLIIQLCLSLATIFLNHILFFTINFTSSLENGHSRTQQMMSNTRKLIFSQCLNTILLPNMAMRIIISDDLIPTVSSIVLNYAIVNAIVQNLLTIFSKDYILKSIVLNIKCIRNLVIRYYVSSQHQLDKSYNRRVNEFYENEDIDMCNAYSFYISTFIHMSAFGFQEPMIILFGLIGITVNCILKRILLTSRYKCPRMIDSQLQNNMMKYLGLAPFFFGLGGFLCLIKLKPPNQQIDLPNFIKPKIILIICALIGLLNIIDFKFLQTNVEVVQKMFNNMISSGDLDTGQQFDFYDDYHVNYDLKNIYGFIQYLMQEKPTDNTLERINNHVTLNEKSNLKKIPLSKIRRFKSQNYSTKKLHQFCIKQQKQVPQMIIEQLKPTQSNLKKPQKQIQMTEFQQKSTIKTLKIKINQKAIPQNNPAMNIQGDQDIQTERRLN